MKHDGGDGDAGEEVALPAALVGQEAEGGARVIGQHQVEEAGDRLFLAVHEHAGDGDLADLVEQDHDEGDAEPGRQAGARARRDGGERWFLFGGHVVQWLEVGRAAGGALDAQAKRRCSPAAEQVARAAAAQARMRRRRGRRRGGSASSARTSRAVDGVTATASCGGVRALPRPLACEVMKTNFRSSSRLASSVVLVAGGLDAPVPPAATSRSRRSARTSSSCLVTSARTARSSAYLSSRAAPSAIAGNVHSVCVKMVSSLSAIGLLRRRTRPRLPRR